MLSLELLLEILMQCERSFAGSVAEVAVLGFDAPFVPFAVQARLRVAEFLGHANRGVGNSP